MRLRQAGSQSLAGFYRAHFLGPLDTGLVDTLCKFVNDTRIGGEAVDSLKGEEALQRDLLPFGCHSIGRT